MPKTLVNQNTADAYTEQGGATIAWVYASKGGWVSLPATVFAQVQHSPEGAQQGQEQWSEEFVLPSGAHYVQPGCIGIRFRSFTAGNPVSVSAAIFFRDEPAIQLGGSGISTPSSSVAALNFQHNDLAVATEPTADFEDASGGTSLNWTVVDDPANTRVKITPVWQNPTILPFTVAFANADTTLQRTAASTLQTNSFFQIVNTSGLAIQNAIANNSIRIFTALTDANPTLNMTGNVINWGAGGASAVDIGIQRYGAQQAGVNTQPGYWRSLHASVGTPGGDGVNSSWSINDQGAASHCYFQSTVPAGGFITFAASQIADTQYRITIDGSGVIKIGPGNAAQDLTITRAVNSPSGTGTFWEMTAGAGFGYGTGTGGTVTQLTSLTTGVTLNKPTGQITCFTSAIAGNLNVTFTVTNSVVGTQDGVVVWWRVNAGNNNMPIWCSGTSAGSFTISYTNLGALTGSVTNIIGFAVIKGATS